MPTLLRVENLTKRFSGVIANDRLNLEIRTGEVHALLGENGAGKSTLMNILYGLLAPDAGRLFWKGEPVSIRSPKQAMALGIGMVHQHFMQVPRLTVLENVVLGSARGFFGDIASAEKRLQEIAADLKQPLELHQPVDSLSVGEQQRVEIYKALYRDAQLLILDEATAMLTPQQAQQLFDVCRRLTAQGKSVIFITHNLDEAMALSHRITVLRQGRNAGTVDADATNPRELARRMVGAEISLQIDKKAKQPGALLLEVGHLSVAGNRGTPVIRDLNLDVHQGEIVGIAGVDGNGQTELVETICGLRRAANGAIRLNGEDITRYDPAQIIRKGISCLPADRHRAAIVEQFSLRENALLGFSHSPPFAAHALLRRAAILKFTQSIVAQYDVKADSPNVPIRHLSGGHQQRFVIGRTIGRDPALLIVVQPTRGLDIVSSNFVRRKLIELRDAGKAILLISMDLDEIMMLSDRVEVIHAGRIVGTAGAQSSREEIGLMMAGVRPTGASHEAVP